MKSDDVAFMAWIDHLPEVGDPILCDRAKLLDLAEQAAELELRAASLRDRVRSGQTALLLAVMKNWTLADIQNAAEAADRADSLASARAKVADDASRALLQPLDGSHLASDALQAFVDSKVIRQHNLLSTATESERLETLGRVLDWWNHAGRPVYERLALMRHAAE